MAQEKKKSAIEELTGTMRGMAEGVARRIGALPAKKEPEKKKTPDPGVTGVRGPIHEKAAREKEKSGNTTPSKPRPTRHY